MSKRVLAYVNLVIYFLIRTMRDVYLIIWLEINAVFKNVSLTRRLPALLLEKTGQLVAENSSIIRRFVENLAAEGEARMRAAYDGLRRQLTSGCYGSGAKLCPLCDVSLFPF